MTSTDPGGVPDVEVIAKAWHALSDETLDAVPFGGRGCTCRNMAPHVRKVLELFYGQPEAEPEGLGAVVVNPVTDGVWVRGAHPALPWYDPSTASPQEWSDVTCEDWLMWDDLPRPLVTQSVGWKPPPVHPTPREISEPTGLGAVAIDTVGETWVRVGDGVRPWHKVDSSSNETAGWEALAQPVRIRSHGWIRK